MALTQADLAKLDAQHEAVQKEMLGIISKTGVSAQERAADNARIKVLNKRAADIVAQQRSVQGVVSNTPSNPTPTPNDISTSLQNLSPNELAKLQSLNTKKQELIDKTITIASAVPQGSPPPPELRSLDAQIAAIQKEQDDLLYKGSKPPGGALLNQQGANTGEPTQIPVNVAQADAALTAAGGREGSVPGGVLSGVNLVEPDTSKGSPDVIPVRQPVPTGQPLPNELHQYPSYTYGISLHLLTNDEYNQIVIDQKYVPKRVLISSAGRYDNNTFPRGEFFNDDFYFDDLELETIIGLNATSRNTNAIKVSFTIIEPYGFSLMERLIKSTSNNYLDVPYLLEIDFFAQNDAGEIVGKLSDISKRIPIKLAAMDIKASLRGSEYAIQAYPFNHSAYDITTVSGPDHIEVIAGNLEEFFASGTSIVTQSAAVDNASREEPAAARQTAKPPKKSYSSYADALTAFYADIKNKNLTATNDRFSFVFDPEILVGKSFSIISRNLTDHASNKMSDKDNTNSIRISNIPKKIGSNDFNPKNKIFSINAGTTIEKVINYAVRMSDYIQQQITTPDDYGSDSAGYIGKMIKNENNYLNWFKIVPVIKLGEWDSKKRVWQRDITYHVQTYAVKNVKLDIAPQGTADSPLKKYEYLYTGKNDDIIEWDLHFNALYYNALTAYKNAMTKIHNLGSGQDRKDEESKNQALDNKVQSTDDPNAVMPMVNKYIVTNTQTTVGADTLTVREMATADLEESLMTMSGADMLQVRLKIIGDPSFIKQDDVFYPPTAFKKEIEVGQDSDQRLTPNRSLRTDYGEVYVQLTFKHPQDIDENTGSMSYPGGKETSVFSGLYKLLKVTSNFSQGAFTQNLEMIRLPNQTAYDYPTVKPPAPIERAVDETATAAEQTTGTVQEATSAASEPTGEPVDGSKAPDTPAEEILPVVDKKAQEDLASVAATAPTETIGTATEPAAVAANPNTAKIEQLNSELISVNITVGRYGGGSESSQSVSYLSGQLQSFKNMEASKQSQIDAAIARDGPDSAVADSLRSDLLFARRRQSELSISLADSQAKLAEAQAKQSQLESQIAALK